MYIGNWAARVCRKKHLRKLQHINKQGVRPFESPWPGSARSPADGRVLVPVLGVSDLPPGLNHAAVWADQFACFVFFAGALCRADCLLRKLELDAAQQRVLELCAHPWGNQQSRRACATKFRVDRPPYFWQHALGVFVSASALGGKGDKGRVVPDWNCYCVGQRLAYNSACRGAYYVPMQRFSVHAGKTMWAAIAAWQRMILGCRVSFFVCLALSVSLSLSLLSLLLARSLALSLSLSLSISLSLYLARPLSLSLFLRLCLRFVPLCRSLRRSIHRGIVRVQRGTRMLACCFQTLFSPFGLRMVPPGTPSYGLVNLSPAS